MGYIDTSDPNKIYFRLIGSVGGPDGGTLKYHAIVNGHQLAKEITTERNKRKVSYYWEDLDPVYTSIQECLDNPPKGTGPHPVIRGDK